MTWTHTTRGRALDLLNPRAEDVDIHEIAMALGNQCRYAGCVSMFYSVAEHSVLIAQWLRSQGHGPCTQMGGLLHDAAEAYTGDITWPMQQVLFGDHGPDATSNEAGAVVRARYKRAQYLLDELIANAAGIASSWLHTVAVKDADLRILLDERAALLTEPPPRPWPIEEAGAKPLGVAIQGWSPERAMGKWLLEFGRIKTALDGRADA